MLTLHTCRPLPREAPPPRVRAHDAERLQVPVVLEEDLVRVADVGGVGVELVGGDAVPGRLHAMALRDRRIDALRPLTLVQLQQIDTTEFPIPSCREVFGKVLGRSPAMLGQ